MLITRDFMYSYITPIIVFIAPLVLLTISKFKIGGAKNEKT
jgi:hypothetical protein